MYTHAALKHGQKSASSRANWQYLELDNFQICKVLADAKTMA